MGKKSTGNSGLVAILNNRYLSVYRVTSPSGRDEALAVEITPIGWSLVPKPRMRALLEPPSAGLLYFHFPRDLTDLLLRMCYGYYRVVFSLSDQLPQSI